MNSNNSYNRYKFAKYYLLVDLLVFIAGIVIMKIFGFNVISNQVGHLVLESVLTILISLLVVMLYIGFRYNWAKAFSNVLIALHNVFLSTALICLIRVPVSETLIMAYVLLIGLTTVFNLIMFNRTEKVDYKKDDLNLKIKESMKNSVKIICVFSAIVIATVLLSMLFVNSSIFNFAREFFVMMIVLLYAVITITLPIYLYFGKKIKAKSKTVVDTSVNNQKVYKAAEQEETENPENFEEKPAENS